MRNRRTRRALSQKLAGNQLFLLCGAFASDFELVLKLAAMSSEQSESGNKVLAKVWVHLTSKTVLLKLFFLLSLVPTNFSFWRILTYLAREMRATVRMRETESQLPAKTKPLLNLGGREEAKRKKLARHLS